MRRPPLAASLLFGALALAGAGFLVAYFVTPWPEQPVGRGRYLAAPSAPPCEATEDSLCFYALGDTGEDSRQRARVVKTLAASAESEQPAFVLLLGDNFYPEGVESADSPRFEEDFDGPFDSKAFPVPFFVALGNHDHKGSVEAQVEHSSAGGRWRMPARYYSFSRTSPDGATVDVFVLDTQPIESQAVEADAQLAWLEQSLEDSTADWRVVAGHHPILSGGIHGGSPALQDRLAPLLEAARVDLYLSGHDHDLQVLALAGGTLGVVSGAGSKTRRAGRVAETLYSESAGGFARVRFDRDRLCVAMITAKGVRYEHHLAPAGH